MDPDFTNSGRNNIDLFSSRCSCADIFSNKKNVKENLYLPLNYSLLLCCTTVNRAPRLCLCIRLLSHKGDMVKKQT